MPAQAGQLLLNGRVGELRLREPELAAQLHLIDHLPAFLGRNQNVRPQVRGTHQERLVGIHRKSQQILDAAFVDRRVDMHLSAVNAFDADDFAACDKMRVQKRAVNAGQIRVAVGTVDHRLEPCAERHRLSAGVDLEVRRFGRPFDVDPVERALEVADR